MPRVSHLFFADNSILFCRATNSDCLTVKCILATYSRASGQVVNLEKSSITFSPNVGPNARDTLLNILCLSSVETHPTYLGLPTFIGWNKTRLFASIKDRVWSKLQTWKGKFFSQAGREILIKAVTRAMLAYFMSVFKLPETLCAELEQLMARFWWGGSVDERKVHWKRWELLCASKSEGGLGFRDLVSFNRAMVTKQCWRILSAPNSLLAMVLKGKYFPGGSFLSAAMGSSPSHLWRGLLWGREVVQKGFRWRVGNGINIGVFTDPWIPELLNFKPITIPRPGTEAIRVSDLIDEAHGGWDMVALRVNLWEVDVQAVAAIPIGMNRKDDRPIWHHDKYG